MLQPRLPLDFPTMSEKAPGFLLKLEGWYTGQSKIIRTVIMPGVISVLAILLGVFKSQESVGLTLLLIALISILTVINNYLSYIEGSSLTSALNAAGTYLDIIDATQNRFKNRARSIFRAIAATNGSAKSKLSAVQVDWQHHVARHEINVWLKESLDRLVKKRFPDKNVNLCLALLKVTDTGVFRLSGQSVGTASYDTIFARVAQISVSDDHTFVGSLWNDKLRPFKSARSTEQAARRREFKFLHEDEKNYLKSIASYRVDNPADSPRGGTPLCVWCVDANHEDVFPDDNDESEREYLEQIRLLFRVAAAQLQFEIAIHDVTNLYSNAIAIAPSKKPPTTGV